MQLLKERYGKKDMEIHKENTEQFAGIEYGDKNFDIEKYFGQMKSNASITHPEANMTVKDERVSSKGRLDFRFRIGRKVATSSAVPKTAGITVEKLKEDSTKKPIGPVFSSPR